MKSAKIESAKIFLIYIESKRKSKNPAFWLLILLKDIGWFFGYFITYNCLKFAFAVYQEASFFIYKFFNRYRHEVLVYHKISFCITCMNRLDHLKKTLRKNIKQNSDYPNLEFVLLDYNSADDLQNWVFKNFKSEMKSGRLVYYKTTKPKYFQMANAKNISHSLATGDIVCNLDADNFTGKDFSFYINSVMQLSQDVIGLQRENFRYIPFHISDCGGRIFLSKENFLKLGGYNEKFIGWGNEDIEFKKRAEILGLKIVDIPLDFLKAISHNSKLRTKNMDISIEESTKLNIKLLEESLSSNNYHIENEVVDLAEIKRIQ